MKILLTGASGLFGANALLLGKDRFEILGIFHKHPVSWPGVHTTGIELGDERGMSGLLDSFKPNLLIHAAAIANIDFCETERKVAYRSNVEIPKLLARLTASREIPIVHFSTDAFFEGDENFTEEDEPTPMNYYGETKLLSEIEVKKENPKHLIVRPNFHGWNVTDKLSLSEWIIKGLTLREPLTLFPDIVFSPFYVEQLCEVLFTAIEKNVRGTLNLVGGDGISKLEFGYRIARIFGLQTDTIKPTIAEGIPTRAKRSRRMTLSTRKMKEVAPHVDLSVDHGIRSMKAMLEKGGVSLLKGKPFKMEQ